MSRRCRIIIASLLVGSVVCIDVSAKEGTIRAGIVGCDTSHVIVFTDLLNSKISSGSAANVKVTVAYPGGSADIPASKDRVPEYVDQLRKKGVTIVDSPDEIIEQCDAVLLESVDGRVHLDQFRKVAKGKPVFIDKPAAASLVDWISILRLADETHTPVYSTSALRFCEGVQALAHDKAIGDLRVCETVGPLTIESHHPDLFWYGIHGVESLFTIMGRGCETVSRTDTDLSALAVGTWHDGRVGSYRGMKKDNAGYGFLAIGSNRIAFKAGFSGYEPAAEQICEFFRSGKAPVSREETIEVLAFMEAADESKRLGGKPIAIREIIERAEQAATARAWSRTPAGKR